MTAPGLSLTFTFLVFFAFLSFAYFDKKNLEHQKGKYRLCKSVDAYRATCKILTIC